jgi:hypothetical protein
LNDEIKKTQKNKNKSMLMLDDKIKKYKSINKFNIDSMLMLKDKIK